MGAALGSEMGPNVGVGLEVGVEVGGAVQLAGRDALELVLLAALLAAHAGVAVEAAERQPLAAGDLDARLARRH